MSRMRQPALLGRLHSLRLGWKSGAAQRMPELWRANYHLGKSDRRTATVTILDLRLPACMDRRPLAREMDR